MASALVAGPGNRPVFLVPKPWHSFVTSLLRWRSCWGLLLRAVQWPSFNCGWCARQWVKRGRLEELRFRESIYDSRNRREQERSLSRAHQCGIRGWALRPPIRSGPAWRPLRRMTSLSCLCPFPLRVKPGSRPLNMQELVWFVALRANKHWLAFSCCTS